MVFSRDYINKLDDMMPAIIEFAPHADMINSERYLGKRSKRKGFLTVDFAFYYNAGKERVLFHLARRGRNLMFHNLIDAIIQIQKINHLLTLI